MNKRQRTREKSEYDLQPPYSKFRRRNRSRSKSARCVCILTSSLFCFLSVFNMLALEVFVWSKSSGEETSKEIEIFMKVVRFENQNDRNSVVLSHDTVGKQGATSERKNETDEMGGSIKNKYDIFFYNVAREDGSEEDDNVDDDLDRENKEDLREKKKNVEEALGQFVNNIVGEGANKADYDFDDDNKMRLEAEIIGEGRIAADESLAQLANGARADDNNDFDNDQNQNLEEERRGEERFAAETKNGMTNRIGKCMGCMRWRQ